MDHQQKTPSQIWELGLQALQALGAQYNPVMEAAAAKRGLSEPSSYDWLLRALAFEPDAMTTEGLRVRSPYVAPHVYEERMANIAAAGYLRCVDRDGYVLTLKGHQAVQAVLQAGYACMAQLTPLPLDRMDALAGLLLRLVDASLAAPEPPGHWAIVHSRKIDPGSGTSVVAQIDQYLSDLSAYRDDCHLSAWAPLGIDGPALEALTYLWRSKDPMSLEELFDALKRRGWEPSDYRACLSAMVRRGWVEQGAEKYATTLTGWAIRQNVEQKTDEYFYRPWTCLAPAELEALRDFLAVMSDAAITKG